MNDNREEVDTTYGSYQLVKVHFVQCFESVSDICESFFGLYQFYSSYKDLVFQECDIALTFDHIEACIDRTLSCPKVQKSK